MGFYFDQTRCVGCFTCCVACKDWHDVPAGPANWMRIACLEQGEYPNPFVAYAAVPCYHCAQPACADACPAGAISKREGDGIVVVDRGECLGESVCGGLCREACPYDAPQFGAEEDPRMQKCDLCLDRWREGKRPICVDACPTRALDAGPLEELRARYGPQRECPGLSWSEKTGPSVVVRPKTRNSSGGAPWK